MGTRRETSGFSNVPVQQRQDSCEYLSCWRFSVNMSYRIVGLCVLDSEVQDIVPDVFKTSCDTLYFLFCLRMGVYIFARVSTCVYICLPLPTRCILIRFRLRVGFGSGNILM